MRHVTEEFNVYSFQELDERSKECARDWFRSCMDVESRPEHDRYICNQCGKYSRRYQGPPLERPGDPQNWRRLTPTYVTCTIPYPAA